MAEVTKSENDIKRAMEAFFRNPEMRANMLSHLLEDACIAFYLTRVRWKRWMWAVRRTPNVCLPIVGRIDADCSEKWLIF